MRLSGPRGVTARQQPAELGVLLHVALAKEDAAVGIEPGRDQQRGEVQDAAAQLDGVVGERDRVQVDDAVDRLVGAVLARHVLGDRPDVVAQVLAPRGLDAAEDPHGRGRRVAASEALAPGLHAQLAIGGPRGRQELGRPNRGRRSRHALGACARSRAGCGRPEGRAPIVAFISRARSK